MRLSVVAVGGLKLPGAAAMAAEYEKRLARYGRIEVVEVKASRRPELDRRRREEADALRKATPKGAACVALDPAGKPLDSPGFAAWIDGRAARGDGALAFWVGGSDGIDPGLLSEAALRMSFSRLTFPHQLFRVMLLEQLYRARAISRGEKYHK